MSIAKNIKHLRVSHGLTQEEFGRIANVSNIAVSQWENGRAVPRMGAIQLLADHFGVRSGDLINEDEIMDTRGMPMGNVPLVGKVHAGKPTDTELIDGGEQVAIPQFLIDDDPDCYACISEGDCMNRVYPEGCMIVISPNKEPQNGSVAVVTIDGQQTVMRRMYRTPNTLVLSPDSFNSKNVDIVITSESNHVVEFGGKVVWYQSAEEME